MKEELNLTENVILENPIKLAIYTYSLKGGGTERVTSLFVNFISKIDFFNIYLFSQKPKEDNEFKIPQNINRIFVKYEYLGNLIKALIKKKIDVLIYQFPKGNEISILNQLKTIKIIFYENSCFLYWIYYNYYSFKLLYNAYKRSKYVISLVPFENDYLFKKWGINSILMNNYITYEYNYVIPSDLSSQIILMIGRSNDKMKRFKLGIEAMKYITKVIPNSQMKIISNSDNINYLNDSVISLKLQKNIVFVDYTPIPEIYFKNSSLHIFPSISESFGLVLSETNIYGIPSILVGLDYISLISRGTINVYDDNSKSIAREAIKILKNKKYRKKLGKESRKSMKKFNNELLTKKWINLIFSVYSKGNYFKTLQNKGKKIPKKDYINILKNQAKFIRLRLSNLKNLTAENLENFSYLNNLN